MKNLIKILITLPFVIGFLATAFILVLLCMTISCGPDEEDLSPVLTGQFETEYTLIKLESTGGAECYSDKEIGDVHWVTWMIDETNHPNYNYILILEDENGSQIPYAVSVDGYTFVGGISGPFPSQGSSCNASINWIINLNYGKTDFTGTETDTLTMSCAPGSCSEVWELIGRQD